MEIFAVPFYDFHWLKLFKPCFLGDLILAFIVITLKMSYVSYVSHISDAITKVPEISGDNVER